MQSKKFFSLGVLILFIATSQISFAEFADLNATNIHYDAIIYAQKNKIVNGYPDGTFRPNNYVNRAEFVKIILTGIFNYDPALDAISTKNAPSKSFYFSDIKSTEWYIPYLYHAVMEDIISGYPDHTFKPANNISFVEAAKIIVKASGYQTTTNPIWYKPYVDKLAELKAIPFGVTSFDYKMTRGDVVEIIYRLKNKITTKDSTNYNKIAGIMGSSNPPNPPAPPPSSPGNPPMISANCSVFPADNPWNRDISKDPLDPNSANYIANISVKRQFLHPDFGGDGAYGMPYAIVSGDQPKVPINVTAYPSESDLGSYPIPPDITVEQGSDSHVVVADKDNCKLYELFAASKTSTGWNASAAATFDLTSNALRPDGWTSADAAGLPIFPGLIRYDEVAAGAMNHAIRFTVSATQKGYIHPATHYASKLTDPNLPPMGLRLRLKADYDISGFTGQSAVILHTLKKYGMIVADNGSDWFITGAKDKRWDDNDLEQLKKVPGNAFEVVQSGPILP